MAEYTTILNGYTFSKQGEEISHESLEEITPQISDVLAEQHRHELGFAGISIGEGVLLRDGTITFDYWLTDGNEAMYSYDLQLTLFQGNERAKDSDVLYLRNNIQNNAI